MKQYFIALSIEELIAWWRLGERKVIKAHCCAITTSLPLTEPSQNYHALVKHLPKVEAIRTLLVVDIKPDAINLLDKHSVTWLDFQTIITIYPLDPKPESYHYIKSVIPSIHVSKFSILNTALALRCSQEIIVKTPSHIKPTRPLFHFWLK
jgi:hypothetical protein